MRWWTRSGILTALLGWSVGGTAAATDAEQEFWQSADRCGTKVCYEEYLRQYPEGAFAVIAGEQVRKLSASAAAALAKPEAADGKQGGSSAAPAPATSPTAVPPISEPEMVTVPGGCFEMGSPESEDGRFANERQHHVCVEAFKIGKFEVTQRQWREVVGNDPSYFKNCNHCPVEQVSWNEVNEYIGKLNARTGKHYRLPTEAEWEYACRGGAPGDAYCGGNDPDALAWFGRNSESMTHPVGQKQANSLGLYDMSGNVWEWTCSAFEMDYQGAETKCASLNDAGQVATRGGARYSESRYVRAAVRDGMKPGDRHDGLGFRLAQD
jgi:formylglycine-generating enzyme required for sulfatase activity